VAGEDSVPTWRQQVLYMCKQDGELAKQVSGTPSLADIRKLIPPMCSNLMMLREHIIICLKNILWVEVKDVEKGVIVKHVDWSTWPVDKEHS
jgi:hypothetical protein